MANGNGNGNGNDGEGLLRRVVRKVAGPARELIQRAEDSRLSQFADTDRAELKAMIERKRRNDFVRKRELDMLRRIRREGLTPEQAAALANANLDDAEPRSSRPSLLADGAVKAKIDAIEKQMVGAPQASRPAPLSTPRDAPPPGHLRAAVPVLMHALDPEATVPQALADATPTQIDPHETAAAPATAPARPPVLTDTPPSLSQQSAGPPAGLAAPSPLPVLVPATPTPAPHSSAPRELPPLEFDFAPPAAVVSDAGSAAGSAAGAATATASPDGGRRPTQPGQLSDDGPAGRRLLAGDMPEVEVREIKHDPELDEAVIAFANAEFDHSEQVLTQLIRPTAVRAHHIETWMVLFDLYRAIGQQDRFEALALSFAEQCGCSPPHWYSLPKLLAEAAAATQAAQGGTSQVGWVAPEHLDSEGLLQLPSQLMQLPQPWVLDWTRLQRIDPAAAGALHGLFQRWAGDKLTMHWIAADRLFEVLQESAPVGVRDADPAFWMARLDALRLVNRPDQFDDVAIDYCVTYEVSPPSWEASRCTVRQSGGSSNTRSAILSSVGDVVTSFLDAPDGRGEIEVASLEISGQLAGDQGPLLQQLDERLGKSKLLRINCALLIRVDFLAAGDLLNWVISKRSGGRDVTFTDVNRLVALMFGAMGITEHARAQLRQS